MLQHLVCSSLWKCSGVFLLQWSPSTYPICVLVAYTVHPNNLCYVHRKCFLVFAFGSSHYSEFVRAFFSVQNMVSFFINYQNKVTHQQCLGKWLQVKYSASEVWTHLTQFVSHNHKWWCLKFVCTANCTFFIFILLTICQYKWELISSKKYRCKNILCVLFLSLYNYCWFFLNTDAICYKGKKCLSICFYFHFLHSYFWGKSCLEIAT